MKIILEGKKQYDLEKLPSLNFLQVLELPTGIKLFIQEKETKLDLDEAQELKEGDIIECMVGLKLSKVKNLFIFTRGTSSKEIVLNAQSLNTETNWLKYTNNSAITELATGQMDIIKQLTNATNHTQNININKSWKTVNLDNLNNLNMQSLELFEIKINGVTMEHLELELNCSLLDNIELRLSPSSSQSNGNIAVFGNKNV